MTDEDRRGTSSLTRYAGSMRDPDPAGARKLAAEQWRANGTIVILPDSKARLDWQDRALLDAIAEKIYGPRGN